MAASTDLVMDLRLNYSNLRRDIQGAKGVIGDFAAGVGGLGGPARRFLAAIGGAVALSVREFAKAEHASEGLRGALAANGEEVDENYKRMVAFSEQMSRGTTLTRAMVQELQTLALSMGISAKQTDEVVKAGVGLGTRFFGGDTLRGVRAASEAVLGNTEQLNTMIPALKRASTETQRLKIINDAATKGFDQAERRAVTFNGSLASLAKSYHEAGAAVGGAFAPEIVRLAGFLEHVSGKIEGMTDAQKKALVANTEFAAGVAGSTLALGKVGTVATGLRGIFGSSLPKAGALGVAIAAIGAAFVNFVGKGETFGERLNDVWEGVRQKVSDVADFVVAKWDGVWDRVLKLYFKALEAFGKGDANAMFADYKRGLEEGLVKSTADAADQAAAAAASGINKQVDLHREGARKIKGAISSIPDAYRDMQRSILNDATASTKKMAAIQAAAAAAGPGGAKNGGKNPAATKADLKYNAAIARNNALKAEEDSLLRERASLTTSVPGSDIQYSDDPLRREAIERRLERLPYERAKAAAELTKAERAAHAASGEATPTGRGQFKRFDPDRIGSLITETRDTIEQASKFDPRENPEGFIRSRDLVAKLQQKVRDLQAMLHVGRDDPELRKQVSTPYDIQNQQAGIVVKDLAKAAEALGSLRVVGVVKE